MRVIGHFDHARFGLITFDVLADTLLRLDDFKSIGQVTSLVGELKTSSSSKSVASALAKIQFDQHFNDGVKKLIVVITSGNSQGKGPEIKNKIVSKVCLYSNIDWSMIFRNFIINW